VKPLCAKQLTLRFKETIVQDEAKTPATESWFASGQRLGYDSRSRTLDPFEHRQLMLAEGRLIKRGLTIVRLPGGHLTTNERPEALAHLVGDFTASVETRDVDFV
jgi:hypothetical protein